MISQKELLEIIALPMLIYDYVNKFKLKPDETIERYLTNTRHNISSLTEARQEVLTNMQSYAPHGKVIEFINDSETDLQTAITLSETKKTISIIFRGSESRSDWFYDFQILKKNLHDNVYVHTGFWKQLHINKNYEKILGRLTELMETHPNYKIIVTGHSLGAALATLCGYELSKLLPNQITVVSFASPRVGNLGFREDFDAQENLLHYRVTNNHDVITATPMIYYKHCGTNVHITPEKYEINENYSYDSWWKFSLWNCYSVKDHDIDLYYTTLKKHSWGNDTVEESTESTESTEPIDSEETIDSDENIQLEIDDTDSDVKTNTVVDVDYEADSDSDDSDDSSDDDLIE